MINLELVPNDPLHFLLLQFLQVRLQSFFRLSLFSDEDLLAKGIGS